MKKSSDKSKTFCQTCKIPVDPNYMHKHLSSERHMRAKASKMFYQLKTSKNPHKKQKIEDEEGEKGHLIQSRVNGVWTIAKDPMTGRAYYKNKYSGKTQINKPIGLKDEDLQEETFNSFVVEDYEKVASFAGQEFEEPELGEWKDLKTTSQSYWFGGSDCESESNEKLQGEVNGEIDENEEDAEEDDDELNEVDGEIEGKGLDRDLLRKTHLGLALTAGEQSVIQITENLKQQLEENDLEQIIVQKPEFKKVVQSTSHFEKRSIKGKSFLRP